MSEQQLFDAAKEDEVDKVKSILEENHNIDINKLCKIFPNKKWTATTLYIASKNNNHDVVKILL